MFYFILSNNYPTQMLKKNPERPTLQCPYKSVIELQCYTSSNVIPTVSWPVPNYIVTRSMLIAIFFGGHSLMMIRGGDSVI
jgi:hypothetical protein